MDGPPNSASPKEGVSQARVGEAVIPVSCTIIACNEADRIERTIKSVKGLVDEIVVVDSGSHDGAPELCQRLGARVVHNPWRGFGPQKRFAEDQARNDWILNLDADEWLTDALRAELGDLFSQEPIDCRSFRVRTRLIYPGRETPCLFADDHNCIRVYNYIRVYNRRATRFRNSATHDEVLPTASVAQLRGEIMHQSNRSVAALVRKMLAYAELPAEERGAPKKVGVLRLVCEIPFQFVKYYILRRHIFGGRAGFVYAVTFAFSRWLRLSIAEC